MKEGVSDIVPANSTQQNQINSQTSYQYKFVTLKEISKTNLANSEILERGTADQSAPINYADVRVQIV